MTEACKNCHYFHEDLNVCWNDASEHCADFVSDDDTCEEFKEKA